MDDLCKDINMKTTLPMNFDIRSNSKKIIYVGDISF